MRSGTSGRYKSGPNTHTKISNPSVMQINAQFPPKMQPLFMGYVHKGVAYASEATFRCDHGGDLAPVNDLKHARFKIFYGGRGAGRSWGVVRAALLCGMGGGPAGVLPQGLRILCVREIQDSLRDSVKKTIADQITGLQLAEYYEVLDDVIRGRRGTTAQGTEFSFEGIRRNTNKVKSYERIGLCIAEEAEPISFASWKDLIPTIRAQAPFGPLGLGAEFWINFNPDQEESETFQRFVVHPPENAIVVKMTYRDNPWFPQELLDDMAADRKRSEDLYRHVWEGECRFTLEGSVYAEELRELQASGRVRELEYNRAVPVTAIFDLGRSDYTSIWFVQRVGFEWAVIDFYQNNRQHIDHYLQVMQEKRYIYDHVWLPHDAVQKTLGSMMSIEEQVKAKGYQGRVGIVPRLSVADGINAVRTILPSCYFDRARCAEGLRMLRNYMYSAESVVEQGKTVVRLGDKPIHNWASHAADAFRYFAVSSRMYTGSIQIELPPADGRIDRVLHKLGNIFPVSGGVGWMR